MKRSVKYHIDFASINIFSHNDKGAMRNLSSMVSHVVLEKEQNYFGKNVNISTFSHIQQIPFRYTNWL